MRSVSICNLCLRHYLYHPSLISMMFYLGATQFQLSVLSLQYVFLPPFWRDDDDDVSWYFEYHKHVLVRQMALLYSYLAIDLIGRKGYPDECLQILAQWTLSSHPAPLPTRDVYRAKRPEYWIQYTALFIREEHTTSSSGSSTGTEPLGSLRSLDVSTCTFSVSICDIFKHC